MRQQLLSMRVSPLNSVRIVFELWDVQSSTDLLDNLEYDSIFLAKSRVVFGVSGNPQLEHHEEPGKGLSQTNWSLSNIRILGIQVACLSSDRRSMVMKANALGARRWWTSSSSECDLVSIAVRARFSLELVTARKGRQTIMADSCRKRFSTMG